MKPAPPRLTEDPEIGALMRHAAAETLEPERLERSRQAVRGRLAALPDVLPTTRLGLKLGVALVLVGGGASLLVWRHQAVEPLALPPTVVETPSPRETPPPEKVTKARTTKRAAPEVTVAPPVVEEPAPEPPRASDLPAQLALYREAQKKAAHGDPRGALGLIDELRKKYPRSPLEPEIRVSRIDYLVAAGERQQAIVELRALLSGSARPERAAELWRLLGDLSFKQGDCPGASAAWQQALAAGLGPIDRAAVTEGLARCKGR